MKIIRKMMTVNSILATTLVWSTLLYIAARLYYFLRRRAFITYRKVSGLYSGCSKSHVLCYTGQKVWMELISLNPLCKVNASEVGRTSFCPMKFLIKTYVMGVGQNILRDVQITYNSHTVRYQKK